MEQETKTDSRFKRKELTRRQRAELRKIYGSSGPEAQAEFLASFSQRAEHHLSFSLLPRAQRIGWSRWARKQRQLGLHKPKKKGKRSVILVPTVVRRADPFKLALLGINARTVTRSARWKALRQLALKRDKYRCRICKRHVMKHGSRQFVFIMAHIKPRWLYPELTFELENVVMLCRPCDEQYGEILELPDIRLKYME